MDYIGFNWKVKTEDGYALLNPVTSVSQVYNLNKGQVFGPYTIEVQANAWENNQQTFSIPNILSTDIPMVKKILTGTVDEMKAQDEAYALLDELFGVESSVGQITLTTTQTPVTDYQVQVWWTR